MLYLCLAYGSEADWNKLTEAEQRAVLAQDEVLRNRGDLVAAVQPLVTMVRALDGTPTVVTGTFATAAVPLAGFSIIEAADLNEAVQLVVGTPCARAGGAIELRLLAASNLSDRLRSK